MSPPRDAGGGPLVPARKAVVQKSLQDTPMRSGYGQSSDGFGSPPAEALHDPPDVLPDAETLGQTPDEENVLF